MDNLLVLQAGISPHSVSRRLVERAVAVLTAGGVARRKTRDLGKTPLPHLTCDTLAGVRGEPATAAERATRALSNELIAELRIADAIVIGSPMYNFGLSTALRAWFDHVIRAGETFSYGDGVVRGLVEGKRAIVLEARDGRYSDGSTKSADFHEPYLRHLLGFIGVSNVRIIRAEGLAFGDEPRAAAIAAAMAEIDTLASTATA